MTDVFINAYLFIFARQTQIDHGLDAEELEGAGFLFLNDHLMSLSGQGNVTSLKTGALEGIAVLCKLTPFCNFRFTET